MPPSVGDWSVPIEWNPSIEIFKLEHFCNLIVQIVEAAVAVLEEMSVLELCLMMLRKGGGLSPSIRFNVINLHIYISTGNYP